MNSKQINIFKKEIQQAPIDELICYLEILYENQTLDEQNTKRTIESNGIGFNKPNAKRMTRILKYIQNGYNIDEWDLIYLRKNLPKYHKQF